MSAYELMARMTVPEILEWIEYDQTRYDDSWLQNARILAKMDALTWARGQRRTKVEDYLPRVKRPPRKRSRAEILANFFWAAAASGGLKS